MSFPQVPPDWQLPRGVNASLWRYTQSPLIAESEDDYFDGHPLFQADRAAIEARFTEPGPLVDLGCGSGRLSLHFAKRGFAVTAVELSQPLLKVVGEKATAETLVVNRVRESLRPWLHSIGVVRLCLIDVQHNWDDSRPPVAPRGAGGSGADSPSRRPARHARS